MMHTALGQFFTAPMGNDVSCRALFDIINGVSPSLMPLKYGKTEPLRQVFIVDAIADEWNDAIFWKGKKPESLGSYSPHDRFHPHDIVRYAVTGGKWTTILADLQARWAERFATYFGYVHVVADAHVYLPEYGKRIMPFGQGLAWHEMEKRLPCVAWSMWFGPEYVQKIGRDKLLSAPVYRVVESAAGIHLQITESAQLLIDDYPAYRVHRDALVAHLGPDVVAPIVVD
jgi:hypothetical protein